MITNNKKRTKNKQSKYCRIQLNRPEFMNRKGVAFYHNNVRQPGWEICSADFVSADNYLFVCFPEFSLRRRGC